MHSFAREIVSFLWLGGNVFFAELPVFLFKKAKKFVKMSKQYTKIRIPLDIF